MSMISEACSIDSFSRQTEDDDDEDDLTCRFAKMTIADYRVAAQAVFAT